MKKVGIELKKQEIDSISGVGKEMSNKEAIYGTIATVIGIAAVYFIIDPCISFFRGK